MMKTNLILIFVIMALAALGCKKNKQQDNTRTQPPTEKKALVTTIAGDGAAAFSDGPALSSRFKVPFDIAVAGLAATAQFRASEGGLVTDAEVISM